MIEAYLSCPISMDHELTHVNVQLHVAGVNTVHFWNSCRPYDADKTKEIVKKCTFFVVILPEFRFDANNMNITSGVKSEIEMAVRLKKDIYLAYKTKDGQIKFYKTTIRCNASDKLDSIKGIGGSFLNVNSYKHNNPILEDAIIDKFADSAWDEPSSMESLDKIEERKKLQMATYESCKLGTFKYPVPASEVQAFIGNHGFIDKEYKKVPDRRLLLLI